MSRLSRHSHCYFQCFVLGFSEMIVLQIFVFEEILIMFPQVNPITLYLSFSPCLLHLVLKGKKLN